MSLLLSDRTISVSIPSPNEAGTAFRESIKGFLGDPGKIEADGQFHKFATTGDAEKNHGKAGFFLLDPIELNGVFGSHRPGECSVQFWQATVPGMRVDPAVQERKQAELRQRIEQERQAVHMAAKDRSQAVWDAASTDLGDHPYLSSHGVLEAAMAVSGRCVRVHSNGVLIVPMQDANGVLWNRQAINAKGHKRFNDGGKVEKLALWVPEPPAAGQPWYSTEGFADALAIHSATGQPVLVAFSAGNMLAAIQERQHQVDLSQLTVAADNDPAGRQAVEKVRTLYPVKAVFPRTGKDGLVRHLGQPGHGRAEGRAGGYSGR